MKIKMWEPNIDKKELIKRFNESGIPKEILLQCYIDNVESIYFKLYFENELLNLETKRKTERLKIVSSLLKRHEKALQEYEIIKTYVKTGIIL